MKKRPRVIRRDTPEYVGAVRSRVAPEAHYAKAFVHCLSFPSHCAFLLLHAAWILAGSRSWHPPARRRVFLAFFSFPSAGFSVFPPLFLPFFFCVPVVLHPRRIPSPVGFSQTRESFLFYFFFPFLVSECFLFEFLRSCPCIANLQADYNNNLVIFVPLKWLKGYLAGNSDFATSRC